MWFGIKGEVEKKKKLKHKILLICEGERTESDYFEELAKRDNSVLIINCGFTSVTKEGRLTCLVEDACKEQKIEIFSFDKKCYVFDLDVFDKQPKLMEYITTSVKDESFNMYYTYPSFEYWILLSFINKSNVEETTELTIKQIKERLNEKYKLKFKNGKKIPTSRIEEIVDKKNCAVINSKSITENHSFTLSFKPTYKLFEEICKDKTNKSNLHDLIDLIDNFK